MIKKPFVLITLLAILLTACSGPDHQSDGLTIEDILRRYQKPDAGEAAETDIPLATNDAECYQEGDHPIGISISEQFPEITTYEEVMLWFCNGAIFEDILNALATEEITAVDADELLKMVSEGKTWNQIWIELGVTED